MATEAKAEGTQKQETKPFGLAARAEVMKQYQAEEAKSKSEEAAASPEADAAQSDGVQPKSEPEPKAEKSGDEDADASESKEAEKQGTPKKGDAGEAEKPKLVPLEALHEAREKLKARTLEARQKDTENAELKKRLDAIEAAQKQTTTTQLPEGADKDPKYASLVTEIKNLKAKLTQDDETKVKNAAEEQARVFNTKVEQTEKDLSVEGFPGFQFTIEAVRKELVKQFNEGELTREEVEDPKVWKAIYKETVFPKMRDAIQVNSDKKRQEDKLKQKKNANLTTNPGNKPNDDSDEEEKQFSPKEYFSARDKFSNRLNSVPR